MARRKVGGRKSQKKRTDRAFTRVMSKSPSSNELRHRARSHNAQISKYLKIGW